MPRRVTYRYAGQGRIDKRRNRRYELPELDVTIGKAHFTSRDWSLGGMRIDGVPVGGAVGRELSLSFSGVRNGKHLAGESAARFVTVDTDAGQCAIEFVGLSDDAFRALEALMTGSQR